MKLRRYRILLAVAMAVLALLAAFVPARLAAIRGRERIDVEQIADAREKIDDILQAQRLGEERPQSLTWFVDADKGTIDPYSSTDLNPPLIPFMRQSGRSVTIREYSQDDTRWGVYIAPEREGSGYVTLIDRDERDAQVSSLTWRMGLFVASAGAIGLAFGWLCGGLLLRPVRRTAAEQQHFLADAAHEMRTPLAIIQASSSQALSRPRESEEYVRSLSEIRSASERASAGVNELLDLLRFNSGQANPRLGPLRLDLLAEEVAASVRPDEATVEASPSEAVVVDADMALLRQALDNVVRNAVRRAGRIELLTSRDHRDGIIDVVDDGPGFDESALPTVFDRYQRGDQRGNAGIGLAIVKAIVTAHGGAVEAANRPEGGASVRLRVPLHREG